MVPGPGSAVLDHGLDHGHGAEHDHHGFATVAAAVRRGQRARRLRKWFRTAVLTLALFTLAAELALRLGHARERDAAREATDTALASTRGLLEEVSDPVLRYAPRPGAEIEVDGERQRISRQGTRGLDLPAVKPAHERRLLCLGGTDAFGPGCGEHLTFAAQLAELASVREAELGSGLVWRALDLSVPGHHLGQTRRLLETHGLALEPDLVVLYASASQIERWGVYFDAEHGLRRDLLPLPVGLKRFLWRWSHLYGWIATAHARAAEDGPQPELEPRVPWAPVRADNQAHARAALAGMAELCRARGVPLFVVHQPLLASREVARRPDWPALALVAWFRGACDELGLPALHLEGWLRGYADGVDRLASGAPPDSSTEGCIGPERRLEALGHLQIARLAHARLRAEGLLP